jgi:hypothetical protein
MTEKSFYPCENKDCINYDQFIMPNLNELGEMHYVATQFLYCLSCSRFTPEDFYQAKAIQEEAPDDLPLPRSRLLNRLRRRLFSG